MINDNNKPNDFVAATLNSDGKLTLDEFRAYDLTPDNTGMRDADYYKKIKQVQNKFTKDGKFDDNAYQRWYDSTLDLYNTWSNDDYKSRLLDSIEVSANDIFSLGNLNVRRNDAIIHEVNDPWRHTSGLANINELGSPDFDIREVAQNTKVLDENGNELDWTPNNKGGLFKGLFRPNICYDTYEKDGLYTDKDGIERYHYKGEYRLGADGDPHTRLVGNEDIWDKELVHYTDTFTRDDSFINKFDFFDSDGLDKSVGGTIAKTAFMLAPYFIPGVAPVLGWIGVGYALSQTLPILGKSIDSMITGDANNGFGRTMSAIQNTMARFDGSVSRNSMDKFFTFENVGKMIYDSAGQLFQQRNIINASQKWLKLAGAQNAQNIGSKIALGYMAATSSNDAWSTAKQMGFNDRTAGFVTLGNMLAIYGLLDSGYIFKDKMFENTWLDEDQQFRNTLKTAITANRALTEKSLQNGAITAAESTAKKGAIDNIKFVKKIKDAVTNYLTKGDRAIMYQAKEKGILGVQMAEQPWWQAIISRGVNEGVEEVMEENAADIMKGLALALQELGFNVSEDKDKKVEWNETLEQTLGRYATAGIGGFIGGLTFGGFDQYEKLRLNKTLNPSDRNLYVNLVRFMADPELKARAYEYVDKMEKDGLLGDSNLSVNLKAIKADDGSSKLVFDGGTKSQNQNILAANNLRKLLRGIDRQVHNITDDVTIDSVRANIISRLSQKAEDQGMNLQDYLEKNDININLLEANEKGFTRFIYDNLTDKLTDVIQKQQEIENRKDQIRTEGGFTDASRAAFEGAVKKDEKIKRLEKELTEYKKEFTEFSDGKYDDTIFSFIDFASSPEVFSAYFNDPRFTNIDESAIPTFTLQNYIKIRTGKEIDNLSEDEKKYYTEKFNDFANSKELYDKLKDSYYIHYNLSERMAKDIMAANDTIGEMKSPGDPTDNVNRHIDNAIKAIDKFLAVEDVPIYIESLNSAKDSLLQLKDKVNDDIAKLIGNRDPKLINMYLDGIDDILGNVTCKGNLQNEYINNYYEDVVSNKILDENDSKLKKINNAYSERIKECLNWTNDFSYNGLLLLYNKLFGDIYSQFADSNKSNITDSVDFTILHYLQTKTPVEEVLATIWGINEESVRNKTANSAFEERWNELEKTEEGRLYKQLYIDLSENLLNLVETEDENIIKNKIEELAENNDIYTSPELEEYENKVINAINKLKEFKSKNENNQFIFGYNTLYEKRNLKDLLNKLQANFAINDYGKIKDTFNEINNILVKNGVVNDKDFLNDLFSVFTNENDVVSIIKYSDLQKYVNNTLALKDKIVPNPINGFLEKLSLYNGQKFDMPISVFRQELDRFNRLGINAEDEYKIESPLLQKTLEQIPGLLNIVEALLNTASNGSNKQINVFRELSNKNKFAEISNNSRGIFASGINTIRQQIKNLIDISNKNKGKALTQQIDTVVNCEPKIANKVIDIFNIVNVDAPDDKKIDAEKIYNEELDNAKISVEEINKSNYAQYKQVLNNFQVRLYQEINSKYPDEESLKEFFGNIINKIGGIGVMEQTDLSPETETISDFTALQWIITNTLENPADLDSKYNTARAKEEFSNIIPFFTQEMILKSLVVRAKHNDFINDILAQIKAKDIEETDASTLDDDAKNYIKSRVVLNNVYHIDGTAGAGKTELIRLVNSILGLYGETKVKHATLFERHLKEDLLPRFGASEEDGIIISDLMKELLGEDWDNTDPLKYSEDKNNHYGLKEDIKQKLQEKLDNGSINDIFDKTFSGTKILCIDEDGFLNEAILTALSIYANKYGITIIGTGDSLQNGAVIKGTKSGLTEDFYTWTSPFLTVSMRTNNNGQKLNQETIFKKLNNIRKELSDNISAIASDYEKAAKNQLITITELIYDDSGDLFAGEKSVKNDKDAKLNEIKKLKKQVHTLNESEADPKDKKHRVLVIASDDTKALYTAYEDDELQVVDKDSIQGGQADYVFVDRSDWSSDKYLLLKDFYTMLSRAKEGTVFVDGDYLNKDNLNIVFQTKDIAGVRLTNEQFLESIKAYKDWRNSLPNIGKATPIAAEESTPTSSSTSTPESTTTSGTSATTIPATPEVARSGGEGEPATPTITVTEERPENTEEVEKTLSEDDVLKQIIEKRRSEVKEIINTATNVIDGDSISKLLDADKFSQFNTGNNKLADNADDYLKVVKLLAKTAMWKFKDKANINSIAFCNSFIDKLSRYSNNRLNRNKVENFFSYDGKYYRITGNGIVFLVSKFNPSENKEVAIPIAILSNKSDSSSYKVPFDKLNITLQKGADVISSKGKHWFKLTEVFDPLFLDDNPVSVLSANAKTTSNSSKEFAIMNKGKAMVHINNDPSVSLSATLRPTLDVNSKDVAWYGQLGTSINAGVQNAISFNDFIEIAMAKALIFSKDADQKNKGIATLKKYFGEIVTTDAKLSGANDDLSGGFTNGSKKSIDLSKYSTLHYTAVNKLISSLILYYRDHPESSYRGAFTNNLFNLFFSQRGKNRNGISITFTDFEGNVKTINIFKKGENKYFAYKTVGRNNDAKDPVTFKEDFTIGDVRDIDYVKIVKSAINAFNWNDSEDNFIVNLANETDENIYNAMKDGTLAIGSSVLREDGDNSKIYSVFDSAIANLLTEEKSDQIKQFSSDEIKRISAYIQSIPAFKYMIYANIIANENRDGYNDENRPGWKTVSNSDNITDKLVTDIMEYHDPIYSINFNDAEEVKDDSDLLNNSEFATMGEISSIDEDGNIMNKDGEKGVRVNNKWMQKNLSDEYYESVKDVDEFIISEINDNDEINVEFNVNGESEVRTFKIKDPSIIRNSSTIENNNREKIVDVNNNEYERIGNKLYITDRAGNVKQIEIIKIPNSQYCYSIVDGKEILFNSIQAGDIRSDNKLPIAQNYYGEKVKYDLESKKLQFIDEQGNVFDVTNNPKIFFDTDNITVNYINDSGFEQKVIFSGKELSPERILKIFLENNIYRVNDINSKKLYIVKASRKFMPFEVKNNSIEGSKVLFEYLNKKLSESKSLTDMVLDKFNEFGIPDSTANIVEGILNTASNNISDANIIDSFVEYANKKLQEYANETFGMCYEINYENGVFKVGLKDKDFYRDRAVIKTWNKNTTNIVRGATKNTYIVTLNDGSQFNVRVDGNIVNIGEPSARNINMSDDEIANGIISLNISDSETNDNLLNKVQEFINNPSDSTWDSVNDILLEQDDSILDNPFVQKLADIYDNFKNNFSC